MNILEIEMFSTSPFTKQSEFHCSQEVRVRRFRPIVSRPNVFSKRFCNEDKARVLASGALLAILSWLTQLAQLEAGAVEFRVSGEIEQQIYKGLQGTQTEAFEVFVRDDDWLIRIHQLRFPAIYTNVMLLDYSCFNKGDCIYTLAHARNWNEIQKRLLADPKAPVRYKAHPEHLAIDLAWAEKARVPRADKRYSLPMIFYAYCSQKYFAEVTGHQLEPPFFLDGRPNSFAEGIRAVPAYFEISGKAPFLPQQISFMHGDKRLLGPGRIAPLTKEWQLFTNAVFAVGTFTNVAGLLLPADFTLTIFLADQRAAGEPLRVAPSVRLHGQVKVASGRCELSSQEMKPAMQVSARVADARLHQDGDPLEVRYSTNRWLTEDEVSKLPQLGAAILERQIARDATLMQPKSTGRHIVVMALLICSTAIFALYAVRRVKQQHQQTTK